MGEMVMKDLFNKEHFLFTDLDKKRRRQSLIVGLVIALLYLASAFTFMNMLYCFADIIGSIVSGSADVAIYDLLRSLPIFLSFFMTLWTLLLAHAFFRNVSDERRMKSLFKNAIAILCFAEVNILYIIIGTAAGKYASLVEGSPSPIYPLDAMLYSILFVAIGVLALLYAKKWKDRLPYIVPSRGPIVTRGRFGYCLVVTLWMLVSLFCFGGFWMGLFIIDFVHGYQAYSIALLLVYLVNACFFIVWEFYYNEAKAESRKVILLPLAIVGLCVAVFAAGFYFIGLGFNLDGPSNVGFGVLPVAFAANVNIATLLVVATPIIVSVVALIKGIRLRKK